MTDLSYLRTFGCESAGCTDPAWAERGMHAPNCTQDEFDIALDALDRLREAAREVWESRDIRRDYKPNVDPAALIRLHEAIRDGELS